MAKGGSLRLSKKDAAVFREEDEDEVMEESAVQTPNKTTFERKNSFLGKLFKKKSPTSPSSSSGSANKPEMGTFSAQFPPPELVEHYNSIYSQIRRKQEATSQVRHGPNGNFVVYERSGMPLYGTTSPPPQPQHPPRVPQPVGIYGTAQPRMEPMYSNPPPPLPYRPPPNPYHQSPIVQHRNQGTPIRESSPIIHQRKYHQESPIIHQRSQDEVKSPQRNASFRKNNNFNFTDTSIYGLSEPSSSSNSSSGPSSIDSQTPLSQRQFKQRPSPTTRPRNNLFDETLVVIEKSNEELESKLIRSPPKKNKRPVVDTIHNNRNNLSTEVIYEVEPEDGNSKPISRASSQSTIKNSSSVAPSFPSIGDLTAAPDVGSNFKSLTAQKLMAGLSFNSIDTLLEVNAAADARFDPHGIRMDESAETIDFGVI